MNTILIIGIGSAALCGLCKWRSHRLENGSQDEGKYFEWKLLGICQIATFFVALVLIIIGLIQTIWK